MYESFQNLFVTPDEKHPLHYVGTKEHGCWVHGHLQTDMGENQFPVVNGIPHFIPDGEAPWASEEQVIEVLKKYNLKHDTLIRNNWQRSLKDWDEKHTNSDWIQRIIEHGGLMLEVACGPGGGFAPLILKENPDAILLMNDIGRWIVHEWKKLSDSHRLWRNVSFAQFDATRCPIKSNSLDCIDSAGGIANISGSHLAIREAYRILKTGGKLFMADTDPYPDSFKQLPEEVQNEWRNNDPDIGKGYENRLVSAGFELISMTETSMHALEPGESELADIATKHGVTMYMQGFRIEAQKPL